MKTLYFDFFKDTIETKINTIHRISVYLEENDSYFMPCQFIEIIQKNDFYEIKAQILDTKGYISNLCLDKKFLFGYPNRTIGYGILKKIE